MRAHNALVMFLTIGALSVLNPSSAQAQLGLCDYCDFVEPGWVTCVHGGGSMGTGCHQTVPWACEFDGGCFITQTDVAPFGGLVGSESTVGVFGSVTPRRCDGSAVARRYERGAVLRLREATRVIQL